jgi:hypothetical protein
MATERDDPWAQLFDAIPRGWIVGRPPFDERTNKWRLFSYERRLKSGRAPMLAEGESEDAVVREMTRLLKSARL